METIGFIKLDHPYPLWLDDIKNYISQNNFGIDILLGHPLITRRTETIDFVKDKSPDELMYKNMNFLLHLIARWLNDKELRDSIILHYQLSQSDGWDVRIHCCAYKSF